jgi:hypothetical protein
MQKRPDHLTAGQTFLVAVAMLSACTLAASCGSSSGSQTPSATPTSSSPSASPTSRPTASFAGIHQGSRVSYKQEVTGTLTGIPLGMDAWLVIRPNEVNAYWPQPGPLQTDKNHHFDTVATFGQSADTNQGETFTLMIVETNAAASQQFRSFLSNPQQMGLGMSGLPYNNLLTQVTVTRS